MKQPSLKTHVTFLLLMLWTVSGSVNAQKVGDATPPPSKLTLAFELQSLPGINAAGSYWEVSYQWRLADQREFDRWSEGGEEPGSRVGTLLSKHSFRRDNLGAGQNRRYEVSVPIKGELLRQMRQNARRPQILWLDATMRIHDAALGADIVKKINPVWGPSSYRDGKANVRVELMSNGNLRWFTPPTPPWVTGQSQNVKRSRKSP